MFVLNQIEGRYLCEWFGNFIFVLADPKLLYDSPISYGVRSREQRVKQNRRKKAEI